MLANVPPLRIAVFYNVFLHVMGKDGLKRYSGSTWKRKGFGPYLVDTGVTGSNDGTAADQSLHF